MKKRETKPTTPKPKIDKSYSGRNKKISKKSAEEVIEDTGKLKSGPKKIKEFSDVGFRQNKRKPKSEKPVAKPEQKKKFSEKKSETKFTRGKNLAVKKAPDYKIPEKNPAGQSVATNTETNIRLNRYIANAGICSRREADELIASGLIKVNNKVVTEMGYKVNLGDQVRYGGKVLKREKFVYVLLNKPKDFITTTDDPESRKTVMDLVKNACEERIYPVGRLDRNTTGLLLLTNDGELSEKLSHPSYKIKKVYQVEINKPLTSEDFEKIKQGVELEDGKAFVDDLAIISPDAMVIGIELHLGRNRIVRRIFEHLNYEVIRLDRVSYAGLTKKDLPRGHWRYLTEKEVINLKHFSR